MSLIPFMPARVSPTEPPAGSVVHRRLEARRL